MGTSQVLRRFVELVQRARRQPRESASEAVRFLLARVRRAPVVTLAVLLGLVLVARFAWIQLATLSLPISVYDGHHWRQSFTFGVAWNYAHTTLDLLRPRMFTELKNSNIVAMETPIYPLVASVFLRASGDSAFGPRLVSWLSLVASAVVLFRLLGIGRNDPRDAWSDRAGLCIALSVSTMALTDFHSVQPEPMAAGLSMIAAGYFIRYRDTEQLRDAILGGVFTMLAVLTKPLVLGIVPGLALFAVWGPRRWLRRGLIVSGAILPGLALYAAWDRWAAHLLRTEMEGLIVISIQHDSAEMLRNLKNVGYLHEALFHFVPNYAGSWWLAPALVGGIFRALSEPSLRRFGFPFLLWLTGYLVELLAFGDRLHSNAYYFILAPAPVVFFCALGIGAFIRALESSHERAPLTAYRVGLAMAVLLPLGLAFANKPKWSSTDAGDLGFLQHQSVWTDRTGLPLIFFVLLVAIACGPRLRPRRIPSWVGVPVMLAVLSSGLWALRDAGQYFRFYAGMSKRAHFGEDLRALRAAIDKFSRPRDRIVANADEMVLFYYALRNGFPAAQARTPEQLSRVRARGARLYVHAELVGGPDTPALVQGELLERGRWWRVYCIDEHGCGR